MYKTFEKFEELADAMCDGEGLLHAFNCAMRYEEPSTCAAWQWGVQAFAAWLDHIGCKVNIPDNAEGFYDFCHKIKELKT